MRKVIVTGEAQSDVKDVLRESRSKFGPLARSRYRLLIQTAYRNLAENPIRPGVKRLSGGPNDIYFYAIRRSRDRVARAERVSGPRHVIAFRYDDTRVEIIHLLHDAMDLPARLR